MPAPKTPDGYVNIPDAAKMLGVSDMTMYKRVVDEGRIPYESIPRGVRTYYYMKKQDVEQFIKTYRAPLRGRPKKKASLYEIVCISCGKMEILFSTSSLMELSHKYIYMLEQKHQLIRVRADGQLLTIHESDRLGNTYHPRVKRLGAI